jgi:hypothetical protein
MIMIFVTLSATKGLELQILHGVYPEARRNQTLHFVQSDPEGFRMTREEFSEKTNN